jgi:Flp pilus assembly protein TadB
VFELFLLGYAFVMMLVVYILLHHKMKIPSRAPLVIVRRIQDVGLTERELEEKYRPLHEKILYPLAAGITKSIKINRLSRLELQDKLAMAGVGKTPEEFMARQVMTGLMFVAFSLAWVFILGTPVILFAGLLFGLLGSTLPAKELEKKIEERKSAIIMELPDFLDMLVLSLRAGRNLLAAVRKASEQSGPTLRPLLDKLQADIDLTENKKDALWRFAESTGVQEAKDFVSALEIGLDAKAKQAEEIYRSQSKIMRDLRALALRRYTKSIPARLSLLHVWLYLNCIGIPIIGAIMQFGAMMAQ